MMPNEFISGDHLHWRGGETMEWDWLPELPINCSKNYLHIHYTSIVECWRRRWTTWPGVLDFGIFIEPADMSKYDLIKLPVTDIWGSFNENRQSFGRPPDHHTWWLNWLPIICSNQAMVKNELSGWLGGNYEKLNIIATYNLLYNASLMVEGGLGYALCLDVLSKRPRIVPSVSAHWNQH